MKTGYDPLLDHQKIFGAHFVSQLAGHEHPVLMIKGRPISKHTLVREYGTGNLIAASRLRTAMADLKIKNIMDFFKMSPRDIADIPNLGTTALFVLICIGEKHGVNVTNWFKGMPCFVTLKGKIRKEKETKLTAKDKRHAALSAAGSHLIKQAKPHARRLAKSA